MARAQIALIIPLGDAPGHIPGYPDQGLPGGGNGGEYPDQGLPGGRPPHVGNRPPGSRPEYPSTGPVRPGRPVDPGWGVGEAHPDQGLPPELGGPIGPTQPWVPPSGEELPPPPDDIVNEYVVAVWNPVKQEWTVNVGGPAPKA